MTGCCFIDPQFTELLFLEGPSFVAERQLHEILELLYERDNSSEMRRIFAFVREIFECFNDISNACNECTLTFVTNVVKERFLNKM